MGKNFIILFREKEGSTPVVRLLANFDAIEILHQDTGQGWEPFDTHLCGEMPLASYRRCLELVYGDAGPDHMAAINAIYTRTARQPLVPFDNSKSVGFKMRFRPQRLGGGKLARALRRWVFERATLRVLREHGVVVFVTVRQDVLRWALSKYHGDGTGRPGHLQFKLADRQISREEIAPIEVDLDALERVIGACEDAIDRKRRLVARLHAHGIGAWPLLYERFCTDRHGYLAELLERLGIAASDDEIHAAIGKGSHVEKVHGEDIAEFVLNAEAVLDRFGGRFARW